jgi:hypothetical protein
MMEKMMRVFVHSNAVTSMVSLVSLVAVLSVATPPASAAEPDQEAPTVGLGMKLPVVTMGLVGELGGLAGLGGIVAPVPTSTLLIPIRLSETLRLEPHLSAGVSDDSSSRLNAQSSGFESNSSRWSVDAGAAVHHLWSPFDATLGYVGLQAGAGFGEVTSEQGDGDGNRSEYDSSFRTLYIGPVIGGEYQPIETFGFGVEASLLARYSTTSSERGLQDESESSQTQAQSHASIFARVYLW